MRTPILILIIFLSSLSRAGDSIPKVRFKLLDLKYYVGITAKEGHAPNIEFVNSFTRNEKYHDPAFYAGYSDTAQRRRNFNRHRNDRVYKYDQQGTAFFQTGANASFKFENSKSRILNRVKPTIGIFYSSRRVFAYNIRAVDRYPIDTLFYQDPKYAPIISDSSVYRNIYYRYSTQQVYLELGSQFNFYQSNCFVFYAGVKYGFGYGYKNEFYVQKDELLESVLKPSSTTIERTREPSSYSSRVTVPIGVQMGFLRRRFNRVWIYAEFCPGHETYTIKNGRSLPNAIYAFTWGLKFQFR